MLLSADYEVFLGGNYLPEEEVLIKPTYKLLEITSYLNVPITLFVDVACIWRYRELGYHELPYLMEKQIKEAMLLGNDVQAHIHPHWKNTIIKDRIYLFDENEFFIGKISKNNHDCYKIAFTFLIEAKNYLERLLKPINNNYECIAFRAGGYGLQPKEEIIIKALKDAGYMIDSSIIPNYKTNEIDFTNVPNLPNYFISDTNGLRHPAINGIYEIPILSGHVGLKPYIKHIHYKILSKIKNYKGHKIIRRGFIKGEKEKVIKNNLLDKFFKNIKIINKVMKKRWCYLEIEDDPGLILSLSINYINKFLKNFKDIFYAVSMHPKNMDQKQFQCLVEYIKTMKKIYGKSLRIITFQETKNILNL
jgi:hypothetical protein